MSKDTTQANPRKGQYVYDPYYKMRRKVMAVPMNGNNLYFIGKEHEPMARDEFIYPLPSALEMEVLEGVV